MRYKKYLLEESEKPNFDNHVGVEGLNIAPNNISKDEQCKYLVECRQVESAFFTLCELFEIEDIEMETTGFSHSFCLVIIKETEYNNQKILRSPELSRQKLKNAESKEIAEAIIDMIKERKKWSDIQYCRTLHIE